MKPQAIITLGLWLKSQGYEFVTVTPESHRRVNARVENAWARDLRDIFGWSRKFTPKVIGKEGLALLRAADAIIADGDGYKSRVRFSTYGAHIFAHSAFPCTDADSVFFGPDTYRFLRAIDTLPMSIPTPARIVDIGAGSGAGGIRLAQMYPSAEVMLTDVNPTALAFADSNAAMNDSRHARTALSDILKDVPGEFDLIVSNPPYLVDAGNRTYRHGGGDLGHDLSLRILVEALGRLSVGGRLVLYTGSAVVDGHDVFREKAVGLLAPKGWDYSYGEIDPDVFGEELSTAAYVHADRLAVVLLSVTRSHSP